MSTFLSQTFQWTFTFQTFDCLWVVYDEMVMGKKLRTMDEMPLDGKRVIVRVDFNVSVGDDGVVDGDEDYRIEAALPTIQELRSKRCRILLLTHRGRPGDDQVDMDLSPIHRRLEELLGEEVKRVSRLYGDEVETAVLSLEPGGVLLLPNVREDEREILDSEKMAKEIAQHADAYVSEAFSVCHRAHTSIALLPRMLPSVAGRRTAMEVEALQRLQGEVEKPYVAITSGSKISTKIGMLRRMLAKVDYLCIGGRIANVFLAAQGKFSREAFNANDIAAAQSVLQYAGEKIVLPEDVVVGPEDGDEDKVQTLLVDEIPDDVPRIWDVGPQTVKSFLEVCREAKTIMWNGPVGRFEVPVYGRGTNQLARGLAELPAFRVVGGGDTVIVLEQARLLDKYNHVSVGGGALIAFLEGKRMPGLEPLYAD